MLDYLWKNNLTKKFHGKEQKLRDEFAQKEKNLILELEAKYLKLKSDVEEGHKDVSNKLEILKIEQRDAEDLEKRVKARKEELLRTNEDLKEQIRLIEAKASPDNVWTQAFSTGFSKAWDMMIPVMLSGIEKVKESIRNQEIEASFPRIESVVEQRLKDIGDYKLIETNMLQQKKIECENKLTRIDDPKEREKLSNYLNVITWILGSRNGD